MFQRINKTWQAEGKTYTATYFAGGVALEGGWIDFMAKDEAGEITTGVVTKAGSVIYGDDIEGVLTAREVEECLEQVTMAAIAAGDLESEETIDDWFDVRPVD